jgi:hypothetical protein
MPSAAPELQAKWPGGDAEALGVLAAVGYKNNPDWTWTRPKPGHEPTERELSAICYMIDEWDYGGLRNLDSEPCPPGTPGH